MLCTNIQSLRITFCLPEPELFPVHLRTFHNWKTANCGCGMIREREKKMPVTVKISTNRIEAVCKCAWDSRKHFIDIQDYLFGFLQVVDLWHV